MSNTFKITKRNGKFTGTLQGAPEFSDRLEAEKWAHAYSKYRESESPRGAAAIEVTEVRHSNDD